jgi:putative cell wall-binding protein
MTRALTWCDRRSIAVLAVILLGSVCALIAAPSSLGQAAPSTDGSHVLFVEPEHSEGFAGWRGAATTVRVVPTVPGTAYFQWDTPVGPWQPVEGPIMVPEGRHTLLTRVVAPDGMPGPVTGTDFRVDYDAVTVPLDVRTVSNPPDEASGTVEVSAYVLPQVGSDMIRYGGRDRYEAGANISRGNFPSSDDVILATGWTYADALSASGLAGCMECPILLTQRRSLPAATKNEILRLGASKVTIVGGPYSVGENIENYLRDDMGLEVERIGGPDRYYVASAIADRVVAYGHAGGRVYIARGNEFADALSLGPLANAGRAPLLLTLPNRLPPSTKATLDKHGFSSGVAAGGVVSISPGVYSQIDARVADLIRIDGPDRYYVSARVARYAVGQGIATYRVVGVATGQKFPDALCGGAAIGFQRGVIVLVLKDRIPPPVDSVLLEAVPTNLQVQVLGGPASVSNDVWDELADIFMRP